MEKIDLTKMKKAIQDVLKDRTELSKRAYHLQVRRVFKQLGPMLSGPRFRINTIVGGPGVVGEVVLQTPDLYVMVNASGLKPVMWRTCKGFQDPAKNHGPNQWAELDVLESVEGFGRKPFNPAESTSDTNQKAQKGPDKT